MTKATIQGKESIFQQLQTQFRKPSFWFFALVLLLSLFVRLRHLDIAFERDEGEYAYAGQEILRGNLPYRDVYNMKLPGTYYFFALIEAVGGDTLRTIKIGLILVNLLNTLLVFLIGSRLRNATAGRLAAGVYLLFSLSYQAQGWTANAEHFVIFPSLLGIYSFVRARQATSWTNQLIWLWTTGVGLMLAFICKQHALGWLIFPPILLFFEQFFKENKENFGSFFKKYFIQNVVYGLGALATFGLLVLYFYAKNNLDAFFFYTFKYAQAYGSIETPVVKVWHFRPIFWDSSVFWLAGFGLLFGALRRGDAAFSRDRWFLILYFLCSFLCVCPGWYFRPHYFQLLLPSAALLAGIRLEFSEIWFKKTVPLAWILGGGLLATAIPQFGYFFSWTSEKVMDKMYPGAMFNELRTLSYELPQKMKNPNGTIGILGSEPQMFFHARKRSASGFIYAYPLYEKQPYAMAMSKQFGDELTRSEPEIYIYFCNNEMQLDNPETTIFMQSWATLFAKKYELIGKLHQWEYSVGEMRWKDRGDDMSCETYVYAYIYRKKD